MAQDTRTSAEGKETVYEPPRHEGTGVDEEELLYESYLLSVAEAQQRLKRSIQGDVVRRAWEAIQLRIQIEDGSEAK